MKKNSASLLISKNISNEYSLKLEDVGTGDRRDNMDEM